MNRLAIGKQQDDGDDADGEGHPLDPAHDVVELPEPGRGRPVTGVRYRGQGIHDVGRDACARSYVFMPS